MKILIVEDDELMQATLKNVFRDAQVTVTTTMDEALNQLKTECFSAAFLDINLKQNSSGNGVELLKKIRERDSYLPCVMISGIQDRDVIMKCLEIGAVEYVVKAQGGPEAYQLALFKAMAWRKLFAESQAGRFSVNSTGNTRGAKNPLEGRYEMKGNSPLMTELRQSLQKLGGLGGPFLILGETGTGKELAARSLWSAMGNPQRPFIALNCASLPENLVESELFGYERGTFTGAMTNKTGLFEAANGGDIFLDEIGELNGDLQAKLLRVLQEKKVRRLGSDRERPVDFRVIAATHQDILAAVRDGDFREDLFYRINVHQIHVPSLRERRQDIPELLRVFWEEAGLSRCALTESARGRILEFTWPGNVRQLKAFSQYVVPYVDHRNPLVDDDLVTRWVRMNEVSRPQGNALESLEAEVRAAWAEKRSLNVIAKVDSFQKNYVQAALAVSQGNRSQAAKILGVSRQRLSNWINEWQLT